MHVILLFLLYRFVVDFSNSLKITFINNDFLLVEYSSRTTFILSSTRNNVCTKFSSGV